MDYYNIIYTIYTCPALLSIISNIITYPAKKNTLHYYISSILKIQYCYISNVIVDHIKYY